jgi:hypothetical protein
MVTLPCELLAMVTLPCDRLETVTLLFESPCDLLETVTLPIGLLSWPWLELSRRWLDPTLRPAGDGDSLCDSTLRSTSMVTLSSGLLFDPPPWLQPFGDGDGLGYQVD